MTHYRTTLYADTKAMLQAECAVSVNGRPGLLHGLLVATNIYVEAHGVTINSATEAATRLPLVNLSAGSRASFERQNRTTDFRGSASLDLEVIVTGEDGESAATTRDTLIEAIKRALLYSDVIVGTEQEQWRARPWDLTRIDDTARMVDGIVLMSAAVLTLSLDLEITHEPLPESEFGGLDIAVQTRDPDDDTTEMEVVVDLDGQEPTL